MKTPMTLQTFDISVTPVSLLHVGSGQVLKHGVEYWIDEWKDKRDGSDRSAIRVIDEERALDLLTDADIISMRDGRLAGHLGEQRRQAATQYRCPIALPLQGVRPQDASEIRQFQRDAFSRPYIPGTAVKGAIRTALLLALSPARFANDAPDRRRIEEHAFGVPGVQGQLPNRDINRFVRVSDLAQSGETPLAAVYVTVEDSQQPGVPAARPRLPRGGAIGPVWCEAATSAIEFRGTLTIEAGPWAERMSLEQRQALLDPARALRGWSKELVDFELRTWGTAMPARTAALMTTVQAHIQAGTTLGLLGWGAGWQAKTIGPRLTAQQIDDLATARRLDRWRVPTFPARFPATRKLADTPDGYLPLGWARIAITPR